MAQRTPFSFSFTALFAGSALAATLVGQSLNGQSFDATGLRAPAEVGATGLVQAGDDSTYARSDFDDSKWLPVDAKTLLREYFPVTQPAILWRRIHIRVSPEDTQLAFQVHDISPAFEVYVNGQKLIQSGRVEPYVPYTTSARLLVLVPATQLRTGSLVIAIRARVTRSWWGSTDPGFSASSLAIGQESALRNMAVVTMISDEAMGVIESLCGLGVALVALALFLGQRREREYLFVFLMGFLRYAFLPINLVSMTRNVPAGWAMEVLPELMIIASVFAYLLMCQAFLRKQFSRRLWILSVIAVAAYFAADVGNSDFGVPSAYAQAAHVPYLLIQDVILPLLFLRELRRGNREAGVLLIPMFLYGLLDYALYTSFLLQQIPAFRTAGLYGETLVNSFQIGIIQFSPGSLANISFWLSLTIIMVLRAARTSRQRAVLEGEMAAAREVQQVILPESVESLPGLTIESIYQPAQEVGGDFFQVIPHKSDGSLLIVAGDVSGKGLKAGMLVALLVGAIRMAAEISSDPLLLLQALNRRLIGRRDAQATCLALRFDPDGAVMLANAGHLAPYLNGEPLPMEGALPLGLIDGTACSVMRFELAVGDTLWLMSDGIVEATNADGQLLGFERTLELVRSAKSVAYVAAEAQRFGQEDDISVICVTRTAVPEHATA